IPPAPPSTLQLPPAPTLTPVAMPSPPASFCSETARVEFLGQVFDPAAAAANANVNKANAYLDEVSRAIAGASATQDLIDAHRAFDGYKPTADQAYHFGMDVLAVRPAIMATPVVACAPPVEQQASAPPPPPPRPAPPPVREPERFALASTPPPAHDAVAAAPARVVTGPKRTIAVGVIQASGGFDKSEDWAAGGALSSMLTKNLADSRLFVVVERTQLDQVLNEQQLRATHVAGGASTPQIKMIPAQYLVVGSVTEFGAPNSGGGFSIGGGSGDLIGGLGIKRETGKVSIDLRVVNTRTGEVVNAFTVTRTVSRTGVAITTDYRGLSVGSDAFSKTPLGEACRQALADAADRIAAFVAQANWEGKVVDFDGQDIIVNAGAEAGLMAGDRLRVERIGRTLTDPDTGQVLSERHETLGEVVIAEAEPKVAHGRFTAAEQGADAPQRGDLVIFIAGQQP
ncbi:MAG: CsgG/HfaB family protein, partial [Caulobacterales bacterium]